MGSGSVVAIFIAGEARAPVRAVAEARAVPGKGLEGDRYFRGTGYWSQHPGNGREVTLIESEAIEALRREFGIALALGDARRNVVTRGVRLAELIGREFAIGAVRLRGVRLCEPCRHLESLTRAGVKAALRGRGGLRADFVSGGVIRVGNLIVA